MSWNLQQVLSGPGPISSPTPRADQHQQASAVPSSTNDKGSGTAEPAKAPMFGSGPETSLKELSWINEPGSETRVKLASTEKPIPDLMLQRFTLGLRTLRTDEARLFRPKSEIRVQPEGKPL